MSKREEGKTSRRNQILKAARQIVEEGGQGGFSMRELAARSGLSLVTPYNLFGSKREVMLSLLTEEMAHFIAMIEQRDHDRMIDRLFVMIDVTVDEYRRRPEYFIALLHECYSGGTGAPPNDLMRPRESYWISVIESAVAAGEIEASVPAPMLVALLGTIYNGSLLEYSIGLFTLEQFGARCGLGFSLLLHAVASKDNASMIWTKVTVFRDRLTQLEGQPLPLRE